MMVPLPVAAGDDGDKEARAVHSLFTVEESRLMGNRKSAVAGRGPINEGFLKHGFPARVRGE